MASSLANQPAFAGVFEEFGDAPCRGRFAGERVDFVACFVQQQVFAVKVVMAALDGGDVFRAEMVAFQPSRLMPAMRAGDSTTSE